MSDPEEEFRRKLRRTSSAPISPGGLYAASAALFVFGLLTSLLALSGPMRWSGLIIVLAAAGLALRTRLTAGRRR